MDPSSDVSGSFLDLSHAACLDNTHQVVMNNPQLLSESQFIFHCAGASVPLNASRLSVVQESIDITTQIFQDFESKIDPYIIVVANPVDIISYHTYRLTGGKVLGTGTLLDTIRMKYYLQQNLDLVQPNISTILLGEHGDSIAWIRSRSTINGKPLNEVIDDGIAEHCLQQVKQAASKIKETQGATYYAVSDCALRIMNEVLSPTGIVLPLSTLLPPLTQRLLKCQELFFSLPVSIGETEIRPTPFDCSTDELEALRVSAKVLSERMAKT